MTAWFLLFWQGVRHSSLTATEKVSIHARYRQYQIGRGTMTQKVVKRAG